MRLEETEKRATSVQRKKKNEQRRLFHTDTFPSLCIRTYWLNINFFVHRSRELKSSQFVENLNNNNKKHNTHTHTIDDEEETLQEPTNSMLCIGIMCTKRMLCAWIYLLNG